MTNPSANPSLFVAGHFGRFQADFGGIRAPRGRDLVGQRVPDLTHMYYTHTHTRIVVVQVCAAGKLPAGEVIQITKRKV